MEDDGLEYDDEEGGEEGEDDSIMDDNEEWNEEEEDYGVRDDNVVETLINPKV